jgi:hypothetical protein
MADRLGEDEHWRVQNDPRQTQQPPPQQQPRAVHQQQQTLDAPIARALHLVVGNVHVPQQAIVRNDALA